MSPFVLRDPAFDTDRGLRARPLHRELRVRYRFDVDPTTLKRSMPPSSHVRGPAAGRSSCCGGIWALVLLCLPLAQQAQANPVDAPDALRPRLEIESLPHAMQARATSNGARPLFETPTDGLRTRLWWGRGAVEVGAGANVNPSTTAPGLAPSGGVRTAVVGLRAHVARGTHLAIERDALATSVGAGVPSPLEGTRLALEFKAVGTSKAAPPLSSGLLRVQMSGTSTLQFRPRSGGLAVTYRAKF